MTSSQSEQPNTSWRVFAAVFVAFATATAIAVFADHPGDATCLTACGPDAESAFEWEGACYCLEAGEWHENGAQP